MKYSQASSLESDKENISQQKKITVKSIHINDILKQFKKIDCIKIDIEGHEYKILPFLIKNKNLISLEVNLQVAVQKRTCKSQEEIMIYTNCTICGCTPKPDEWSGQVQGVCFDCG